PPQPVALLCISDTGFHTHPLATDLHADVRVFQQVVVPAGVRITAATGCNDDQVLAIGCVYESRSPLDTRFRAGGTQEQHWETCQPRKTAIGLFVQPLVDREWVHSARRLSCRVRACQRPQLIGRGYRTCPPRNRFWWLRYHPRQVRRSLDSLDEAAGDRLV